MVRQIKREFTKEELEKYKGMPEDAIKEELNNTNEQIYGVSYGYYGCTLEMSAEKPYYVISIGSSCD